MSDGVRPAGLEFDTCDLERGLVQNYELVEVTTAKRESSCKILQLMGSLSFYTIAGNASLIKMLI